MGTVVLLRVAGHGPLDRVRRSAVVELDWCGAVGRRQQPRGVGVPAHPEAEAGLEVGERLLRAHVRDDLGAVRPPRSVQRTTGPWNTACSTVTGTPDAVGRRRFR